VDLPTSTTANLATDPPLRIVRDRFTLRGYPLRHEGARRDATLE
jgi:hypothetical protein